MESRLGRARRGTVAMASGGSSCLPAVTAISDPTRAGVNSRFCYCGPGSKHRQHAGDERVAHDVAVTEPHHRDIGYGVQSACDLCKSGEAVEKITLVGIASHDHCRMPAQPRQQHLDLAIGAVLRLVDDDESVVQGAAAHIGDRRNLDCALGHQLFDPFAAEPLVQRIVQRAQIGCQLLVDVTGQVTEALAGLDCGAGQHDAADLPGFECCDRCADSEISLSGPRRPQSNCEIVMFDRRYEAPLAITLRAHLAAITLLALWLGAAEWELVYNVGTGMSDFSETDRHTGVRQALSHRPLPLPPSTTYH